MTQQSKQRAVGVLGSGTRSQERMSWECTCEETGNWEDITIKWPEASATSIVITRAEAGQSKHVIGISGLVPVSMI
jgi:hypothetical protein